MPAPGLFIESWWPNLLAPRHRMLHWALLFFAVPYFYSHWTEKRRMSALTVEQAMSSAWERSVAMTGATFKKVVVGFNTNVDLIVSGTQMIDRLNTSTEEASDHEAIATLEDLHSTFAYFFQRGARAERYISSDAVFKTLIGQAESNGKMPHYHVGGNAALMAERLASSFPTSEVYLVGPIGPRSQTLLHPSVKRTNSTRIVKDEMHIILEYKQGEMLNDWVAPSSSRFIVSHDTFSGSSIVIEMFFKAVQQFDPELVIITGLHILETQSPDMQIEKLRVIKRNLMQIDQNVPIHFELVSLGDATFMTEVLNRIISNVDSLGINEQELLFISHIAGGPNMNTYPMAANTIPVHKVVDMLYWLMKTYGRDRTNPESPNFKSRLQRIHFRSLTFHIMVSTGTDWSNLQSSLAAGARLAGRLSCAMQSSGLTTDLLEVRTGNNFLLDKHQDKKYNFDPHNPMASWMRDEVLFVYTPVLVCRFPLKTVGVDDAISATALMYSQFYRPSW